jgi:hypothetical protein
MKTKVLAILGMFTLLSSGIFAQNSEKRFGFEINAGASFPANEIANTRMKAGPGFEGLFHYRFMPHLGVYGGWGWNKLSADNSFAGSDVCFEETGYIFGLQFAHPIADLPVSFYVRGAGLYNHIEIENAEGDIVEDTGHGLGFQLASGINIDIGNSWTLNPGVKFNALSRDSNYENTSRALDYRYVSLRVGIIKYF